MHMSDALLSPVVGGAVLAASLTTIAYSSKKLSEDLDERMVPLMGVLGAFIFATQMINFTIPGTGASGHLGGGMLLAIVLGPFRGLLVMASVLTVQALFFADGGLLALGCNIWNLGFYTCFLALPLIYRPLTKNNPGNRRIAIACILSAVIGLQLGSFSLVVQTFLSGKSELPFGTFLLFMQPIHLAIGIVEGVVTAGIITFLRKAKPEVLKGTHNSPPPASGSKLKPALVALAILAAVTAGTLSWFSSTRPDGLEWSIEKTYGKSGLAENQGITATLKGLQERSAVFPDYTFKQTGKALKEEGNSPPWRGIDMGRSISGVIGAIIVLCVSMIIGLGIRAIRVRRH